MVLARFLPRDEQFFDQFQESADNASDVTRALLDVVAHEHTGSGASWRRDHAPHLQCPEQHLRHAARPGGYPGPGGQAG